MNLQCHMTKKFLTDKETGAQYCVTFIDYENKLDGYAVLIQKEISKGKWQNIEATDTTRNPTIDTAKLLIVSALKQHHA